VRKRLPIEDSRDQPRTIGAAARGRNREQQSREADGEISDVRVHARGCAHRRLHGGGISAQVPFDARAYVFRARGRTRRGMGRQHGYGSAQRPAAATTC
jgi:hypothetical protein